MLSRKRAAPRRLHGAQRARSGFTLIEIVVVTGIIVIMGAIAFVTLSSNRQRQKVDASLDLLRDLTTALYAYDSATANSTTNFVPGRFPSRLHHLTNQITSTNTANCPLCRNSCGMVAAPVSNSRYTAANVTGWTSRGPFYSRDIKLHVGFLIPIGLVRDSLTRIPAQTATNTTALADTERGRLQIRIDSVRLEDMLVLKSLVDGTSNAATGILRWSDAVDAEGRIPRAFWTMPIRGC